MTPSPLTINDAAARYKVTATALRWRLRGVQPVGKRPHPGRIPSMLYSVAAIEHAAAEIATARGDRKPRKTASIPAKIARDPEIMLSDPIEDVRRAPWLTDADLAEIRRRREKFDRRRNQAGPGGGSGPEPRGEAAPPARPLEAAA